MRLKFATVTLFLVFLLPSCVCYRHSSKITEKELRTHARILSSPEYGGRLPGTTGDSLSEIYIRKQLLKAGARPLSGDGIQKFSIPFSAEAGPSNRMIIEGTILKHGDDFSPMAMSNNTALKAEVVFAGYGFSVSNDSVKWDDYQDIDVRGKWVMVLRGYPEGEGTAAYLKTFSDDRTKALTARDKGAGGVILVSGEKWDTDDKPAIPSRGAANAGIAVIQVRRNIADMILKGRNMTLSQAEKKINSEMSPSCFNTGCVADAVTEITTRNITTANIAMMVSAGEPSNEYVIAGAHFDHLGTGGQGSSSRAPDTVAVHPGADDNASGVALLIELAERLAKNKNSYKRNILFVAFTAEEMGLLGSKYFVGNMGIDPADINIMINIDMAGRMKEGNGLQIGGTGTAEGLRDTLISLCDTSLLSLSFSGEGYGPSDHSSFYGKNIPVLFFTTGAHTDYHTPGDTYDKLNYQGMVTTGNYLFSIISHAACSGERYAFREAGPAQPVQAMRRRGVTLGIMPDFAGNVKNGLRADFVTPGRPADLGGMKKGDIIVAIEGLPVNNIEDYMFRLNQLKHGQTITVEVLRGSTREVLLIQL